MGGRAAQGLATSGESLWKRPSATVDRRMLTHPVWSTWARFKTQVDQNRTLAFAAEIRRHGFNDSQLEIDDRWETCYGELRFLESKFPDANAMIDQLHDMVDAESGSFVDR